MAVVPDEDRSVWVLQSCRKCQCLIQYGSRSFADCEKLTLSRASLRMSSKWEALLLMTGRSRGNRERFLLKEPNNSHPAKPKTDAIKTVQNPVDRLSTKVLRKSLATFHLDNLRGLIV